MFNPEKQFATTQSEYMSTAVLPNAVKYSQLQPRATSGRGSVRRFQSSNGTVFNPAANNIIRIDVTGDKYSFLDGGHGFLEITIDTTGGVATQQLDGGIWSIINQMRIESNTGIELERINNYNLLHNKLFQYQTPPSHLPISNATSGTVSGMGHGRGDAAGNNVPSGRGIQFLPTQNGNLAAGLTSGAAVLNAAQQVTLTMPLVSGFLSNNNGKYIPLGSSSGFTIELTLENALTAFRTAAVNAPLYTVQNITYNAPIIYITGQEFQSNWVQLLNATGGVAWAGTTYSNHVNAIAAGTAGEVVIPINERCRSLNSLITIMRTTANVTASNAGSLSNSSVSDAATAGSYQYRVGDILFPPSRVQFNNVASLSPSVIDGVTVYTAQNMSQSYAEVMKAFGMLNNKNEGSLVTLAQFANVENVQGLGLYGVDLEAYLADSGVSESGIDTASNALQVNFEGNVTFAAATRTDTFAMKTAIYHLSSDGSFSVSQ
tara:strand:+ start:12275 stop:13741 length:1467 start_codon:yes stop_codon:yes gene_type:complete